METIIISFKDADQWPLLQGPVATDPLDNPRVATFQVGRRSYEQPPDYPSPHVSFGADERSVPHRGSHQIFGVCHSAVIDPQARPLHSLSDNSDPIEAVERNAQPSTTDLDECLIRTAGYIVLIRYLYCQRLGLFGLLEG